MLHTFLFLSLPPASAPTSGRPRGDGGSEENQSCDGNTHSHASQRVSPPLFICLSLSLSPSALPQIRRLARSPRCLQKTPRRTKRRAAFLAESQRPETDCKRARGAIPPSLPPPLPPASPSMSACLTAAAADEATAGGGGGTRCAEFRSSPG